MTQVGIIGLGLIGTSLGLALKAKNERGLGVIGYDRDGGNARQAKKMGAVDSTEHSAASLAAHADIVIVATPIIAIQSVFEEIAPALRPNTVVTDVASVKGVVIQAAEETLPSSAHFVGGHPMAGSDRAGPGSASPALFVDEKGRGRTYCIVPSLNASEEAIQAVTGIAETVGAAPRVLGAEDHDALVAAVSHMPILLSVALFTMARGSVSWDDIAPLAGPAFADLTRLAKGSPEMALDILAANQSNVLHWLDRYEAELQRLKDLIRQDERPLHELLLRAQADREVFEEGQLRERQTSGMGDQFMTLMVGERLAERMNDMANLTKTDHKADRLKERERARRQAQGNGQHENGSR